MSGARDVADRLRKRRTVEKVTTDEGTLYVRGLSGRERSEWVTRFMSPDMEVKERLLGDQNIVALALCDEHGAPLYDDPKEAFEAVCDWSIDDVAAAAAVVTKMSGMAVKATEDAAKKSEASPS